MSRSAGYGTEVDTFEEKCGKNLHDRKIRARRWSWCDFGEVNIS